MTTLKQMLISLIESGYLRDQDLKFVRKCKDTADSGSEADLSQDEQDRIIELWERWF